MPSLGTGTQQGELPDFVLGDAHGSACAPRATRAVETLLQGRGRRVQRNDPYAGGYITRHYGHPRQNIHAIQIEIARGLYMEERTIERGPGFGDFQAEMAGLVEGLLSLGWDALLRACK